MGEPRGERALALRRGEEQGVPESRRPTNPSDVRKGPRPSRSRSQSPTGSELQYPQWARAIGKGDCRGVTLIELLAAVAVILVALLALAGSLLSSMHLQQNTAETESAYNACRSKAEELRSTDFTKAYSMYNSNPLDDPGGVGTAPGCTFSVPGLNRVGSEPVGRIEFPEKQDSSGDPGLREDVHNAEMGMASGRDLNGDGVIDSLNHNSDYIILPVLVRVTWMGLSGPRTVAIAVLLTDANQQ